MALLDHTEHHSLMRHHGIGRAEGTFFGQHDKCGYWWHGHCGMTAVDSEQYLKQSPHFANLVIVMLRQYKACSISGHACQMHRQDIEADAGPVRLLQSNTIAFASKSIALQEGIATVTLRMRTRSSSSMTSRTYYGAMQATVR